MQPDEMILDEKERNAFCGLLQKQFGIQLHPNNELLPIYFIGFQAAKLTEKTVVKAKEDIEVIVRNFDNSASSTIKNLETKQYYFKSSKEAFWFAFGKFGIWWISVLVLVFTAWSITYYNEKKEHTTEYMEFLLEKAEIQERKVNDTISVQLITLRPAKDLKGALAGENYVYRQDCKCIEIPLYYQKKLVPSVN